jgi:basic membrane protein A
MAVFARALEKLVQHSSVTIQDDATMLNADVKPAVPEPLVETRNDLKLQEHFPPKRANNFRIPVWLIKVGGGLLALSLLVWLIAGVIIPGIDRSRTQSATEQKAQIAPSGTELPAVAPTVTARSILTQISTVTLAAAPFEEKLKVCQVTDTGGIDDKSFNATAWLGMQKAEKDFGFDVFYLESQQQSDYEVNLNTFVEANCDLIVPVGFLLADATSAAADTNTDQKFAIVDVDYLAQTNILGNASKIDQATFLAGYLAAGMTKTGKVGTYVGILFPATQAFMDGYAMGVAKYNEVHGTSVTVLGWNMETQEGLQVGNFESLDDGRAFGEQLLDEGADIIMPVAGPVGLGTLAVMQERGTGLLIGVDNDWSVANPDKADFILGSALKKIDVFVYESIKAVVDGTFKGGAPYLLTLENQGVGLQYGSAWESKVPAELKAEVEALIPGIISGVIATMPTR